MSFPITDTMADSIHCRFVEGNKYFYLCILHLGLYSLIQSHDTDEHKQSNRATCEKINSVTIQHATCDRINRVTAQHAIK